MAIQKIKNRYVGGMSFIALASYRVISTISIRKYIPTGRTGPWRAADRWTIHYPWNITDDHIHVSDSGLWIGFKGKDRIFQSRLIASFPSELCYDQIIQQYANALARHACWYDHVWCYEYHTVVIFLVLWNMYTHTHTLTYLCEHEYLYREKRKVEPVGPLLLCVHKKPSSDVKYINDAFNITGWTADFKSSLSNARLSSLNFWRLPWSAATRIHTL